MGMSPREFLTTGTTFVWVWGSVLYYLQVLGSPRPSNLHMGSYPGPRLVRPVVVPSRSTCKTSPPEHTSPTSHDGAGHPPPQFFLSKCELRTL